MPPSETFRLHAYVTGRVQGVGYRFFVLETAHDLSLVGWARNLPDRRVEGVAEGERRQWGGRPRRGEPSGGWAWGAVVVLRRAAPPRRPREHAGSHARVRASLSCPES